MSDQDTSESADFKSRYRDHTAPDCHVATHFMVEHCSKGPVTVVTIAVGGAVRHRTFDTADAGSISDLRSFIASHETLTCQVFWLPNAAHPGCKTVPSNEDIETIRHIVLDFDPAKDEPLEDERDRLRRVAHDLIVGPVQPRAVVDTGGGMQVVFQLLEPLAATPEVIEDIEALMRSLAKSFGADTATCKAKNLFRVPGTYNHPTPAKKAAGRERSVSGVWFHGGPRTSLSELRSLASVRADEKPSEDIEIGVTEHEILEVLGQPENLPGILIARLRDPVISKLIEGVDAHAAASGDRSGADHNLNCKLLRFWFTPHDVALVMAAYGSHKAIVDRGYPYIVLSVKKAVKAVANEDLLVKTEEMESRQNERDARSKMRNRMQPVTCVEATMNLFNENRDDLVQGLIKPQDMLVLYGRPGSGKTFVALDLAYRLSMGEIWNGRTVRQMNVLYIATEATWGIRYRLKALSDRFGPSQHFWVIPAMVNLYDARVDLPTLIDNIRDLKVDIGLIVIDTLARTMIGGNENSTADMSKLVAHGDLLREGFKSALMWVHHTGKNEALGARGSTALVAATDIEIEIADSTFRTTKMREAEEADYRFKLQKVTIGTMPNGEEVTTCIVNWFSQSGAVSGNTPENIGLKIVMDILRHSGRREFLSFEQILQEADLAGKKFPVKNRSLKRALDRACARDDDQIFIRRGAVFGKNQKVIFEYGLVNW